MFLLDIFKRKKLYFNQRLIRLQYKKRLEPSYKTLFFVGLFPIVFFVFSAESSDKTLDIVKLPVWASSTSDNHKKAVVERALELTKSEFGEYIIIQDTPSMNRNRSLRSIQEGRATNIHIIPKTPGWDKKTIPINIPIRRGILSYRLLLTTPNRINLFREIKTLDHLKLLRVGINKDSSTIKVLKSANFNIVPSDDFSSLHSMLKNNRIDYLLRGPHEIFDEGERTKEQYKDFSTVEDIVVFSPLPTYIYVSPKHPNLAKRMRSGLLKMQENGDMKRLFYYYFGEFLEEANLKNRRVIYLENKSIDEDYLENQKNYWYAPDEDPVNFSKTFKDEE